MFKIESKYKPTGDQPKAIDKIVESIESGNKFQTLLGVTGSGKTFTMANIIERTQKPALILAHNKTLVGQLYSEFKEFFPNNPVEYFVSYYDYYQPEAYVPHNDLFIEKEATINDEIDKLRHSATSSLLEDGQVIVVASVSCIYGLGNPEMYKDLTLSLRPGMIRDRDEIMRKLVEIQYERNEIDFTRGTFRAKGDVVEVIPPSSYSKGIRIEFFGDEIEKIKEFDVLTGNVINETKYVMIFPASHFVTTKENMEKCIIEIERELEERVKELTSENKLIEAQRIRQRTNYDIEMMREMGYCSGIENYSRILDGREAGTSPLTLLDYFSKDYLLFIDESHVSIPQVKAMYGGDRSRKENLVEYGFRLPSAFDNRPLKFEEFEERINQCVFVTATPGAYEKEHSNLVAEQIIRPTGLIDPEVEIRPIKGQIDDLFSEIQETIKKGFRVLVTTLTKRMSEDLTKYFAELNLKVTYMHSDIDTMERMEIIKDLRNGEHDVLIGINLLREGLDIPEVALVAILDADKEGFLRSETSLIQTIGRAARNSESKVIMYADTITRSMKAAIDETDRRREIQKEYNTKHGITPTTIIKEVRDVINLRPETGDKKPPKEKKKIRYERLSQEEIAKLIIDYEKEMKESAKKQEFELSAELRDKIKELKKLL